MSIQYDLRENPFKEKDGKAVLYPGVVVKNTLGTEDLLKNIANHSTFQRGVALGVLEELKREIVSQLRNGNNVRIDGLGTFSLSLSSREVTEKSEIRSPSIRVENVHFRPAPEFVKGVSSGAQIERAQYKGFQTSSREHTADERWTLLEEYLRANGSITRLRYSEWMGLARSTASRELRRWKDEKKLRSEGRHAHVVYFLAEAEEDSKDTIGRN